MKTRYIILLALLSSCSLFKKTTKTTNAASFDLSKQTEAHRLELQTAQKETQIYSFWKDSIFYQYAMVKEQVDKANTGSLSVQENQELQQAHTSKESKPVESWVYVIFLLGLIVFVLIFKKLIPTR